MKTLILLFVFITTLLFAQTKTNGIVELKWEKPSDMSKVDCYFLLVYTNNPVLNEKEIPVNRFIVPTNRTSCTVSNLNIGTKYWFTLRSFSVNGLFSELISVSGYPK